MSMDWDKAKALLDGAQRIILLTHITPDGDAIGSSLGLGHALRARGKQITWVVDEGAPGNLRFLPGADQIQKSLNGAQADLAIVTDCSDERRMGEAGKAVRALNLPLINLDHHITNTLFADANLVDALTAAAAEGVLDWLDHLEIPLTPDAAQCLLCGLVTDTLCFRTDNTTAATLGKAQRLMTAGGDLSAIIQRTVSRIPAAVIRLWGLVMPTVRLEDHVIWVKIAQAASRMAGAPDGKDGGLVSLLLQADEAYIACVLTESEAVTEISLRAVPGFDVSGVALSLGGGGHKLAAGAPVDGTLDEVEARVIPLLKAAARAGKPKIT
jgi:phosphoesterase RecJ-like protein